MPNIRQSIVKHSEYVLVIIGACVLSIGLVMGPGWLTAIQNETKIATDDPSPPRVSGSNAVRTEKTETLTLPVIPARRVQGITPPRTVLKSKITPKPRTSSAPQTKAPRFSRVLNSVAAGTRMHGEDVRALQIRLMVLAGVDPRNGGDGWFGPRTAHGLKKFQMANGLPATGVADRKTWNALFSSKARRFAF